MPKNVLISSREFYRHIPSYSTTQAASNKGCLHSLCWGVSLRQRVTCVTISNKGNVVCKIVNEYNQEIPQSQTADNPVAP